MVQAAVFVTSRQATDRGSVDKSSKESLTSPWGCLHLQLDFLQGKGFTEMGLPPISRIPSCPCVSLLWGVACEGILPSLAVLAQLCLHLMKLWQLEKGLLGPYIQKAMKTCSITEINHLNEHIPNEILILKMGTA